MAPICLDLHGPAAQLGAGTADGSGTVVFTFTPPDLSADVAVTFQAIGRSGATVYKSQAVADTLSDPDRDADADGLDALAEWSLGTNPTSADTDSDGIRDGSEGAYGTSPLLADTDGDLLADGAELTAGTDPLLSDTDHDGLLDGEDLASGASPLLADTDADGLGDLDEVRVYGSDPAHGDSDADGISDPAELVLGSSLTSADTDADGTPDGLEDPDGDGVPTLSELWLGMDPSLADTDADGTPDGAEDADLDEVTLAEEVAAGSSPWSWDSDNDGLTDALEVLFALNPQSANTDADQCLDLDEFFLDIADPHLADSDGDGLADGAPGGAEDHDGDGLWDDLESECGTALNNPDSDNDGVLDGADDSDGDGLSNLAELRTAGSESPLRCNDASTYGATPDGQQDADADNVTNAAERAAGTNLLHWDTDNDGAWDYDELSQGTNPLLPDSNGDGVGDAHHLLVQKPGIEVLTESGFNAAIATGTPVLVLFTAPDSPMSQVAEFSLYKSDPFLAPGLRRAVHVATTPAGVTAPARTFAMNGPFLVAPTLALFDGAGNLIGTPRGPMGMFAENFDYLRAVRADLADGVLGN